jgi:hypothetical protein
MYGRTIFTTTDGAMLLSADNRYPSLVLQFENDITSIDNNNKSSKLSIFPNPMQGRTLNIALPEILTSELIHLQIFDMKGLLVFQTRLSVDKNQQLQVPNLKSQVYLVKCFTTQWSSYSQLIKI